jgi:phosphatidylinositol 4-kinase
MSFYLRLRNSESIIKEVTTQIRLNPAAVSDLPQALSYLVTTETLLSDVPEVGASVIVLSACFES